MGYCKNCGAYIPDGRTKCLACGLDQTEEERTAASAAAKKSTVRRQDNEELRRQLEDEQESMRLYGENITPAAYEILLNARDRKTYGQQLLDAVNAGSFAKIGLTRQDAADITGGLILRCGEVEINCSLRMMFDEVRRRTEGRVSGILFGRDA